MSGGAIQLVTLLFWVFAAAIVILPRRWALVAYLLIAGIDMSGAVSLPRLVLAALVRAHVADRSGRGGC